jgi:ectoine hydroxylase-related dioxygenase (phytanoyl-CoA dioxygenase family)
VVAAFEKLWGTDELLTSFDGINFTLPGKERQLTAPWPHIDQSPRRKGLVCAQGIINFAPNGPDDGGLVVIRNSHNFTEQFFKEHPEVVSRKTWGPEDWFGFEGKEVDWFIAKGCDVVKVCADPGDLIVWDSRTIHYNSTPTTDQIRSIVCESSPLLIAAETS